MKSVFLFFSFIVSVWTNSFGQRNDLILTAKSNGFTQTIHEGSRISINCSDGRYLKGKLGITNNSQIMLGNDKVSMNEIQSIRYSTAFTKSTSSILIVGGGLIIAACGYSLAKAGNRTEKTNFNPIPVVGLIAVGATFSTCGILHWIKGRKYNRERWDFSLNVK